MSSKYAQFKVEDVVLGIKLNYILEAIDRSIKSSNGSQINQNNLEIILGYEISRIINLIII